MDRLLEAADQQASSVTVAEEFDESLFQQFMSKTPIQCFHSLSKDEYLHRNRDEKQPLVLRYNEMENDENKNYFFVSSMQKMEDSAEQDTQNMEECLGTFLYFEYLATQDTLFSNFFTDFLKTKCFPFSSG